MSNMTLMSYDFYLPCIFAMIRDIVILMKMPLLRKKWINTAVKYIRKHYGSRLNVDAIVGPDTREYVFAVIIASKLGLPYIPIQKVRDVQASPNDVIQNFYMNRKEKVNIPCLNDSV